MPEYVLPYAIHLLAYHPDFPVHKARGRICTLNRGSGCGFMARGKRFCLDREKHMY